MSIWKSVFGGADAAQQKMLNDIDQDMYSSSQNSWINRAGYSMSGLHGVVGGQLGTNHVTVSDPSHIPPGCVQVNWGGADIWIDYNTGTIYSTSASGVLGITDEERKRITELEEERKRATKQAKLDIFKKLPAAIRQDVVNTFVWEDAVSKMDTLEVPKSEEQVQLENKDTFGIYRRAGYSSHFGQAAGGMSMSDYVFTRGGLRMPKDFTAEELMRAHNEATMEEELLGDTDPK